MLIPYSTDAPIYYFPFATIGLIVANVLLYFGTVGIAEDPETLRWLMLEYDTINPFQWLSNNFMHMGIMHLVGNMIFLWSFGLIVEGKLGWKIFLGMYLAMGIVYGAIIQFGMFLFSNDYGCALGASSVIFAVMGIAVCWAPKNELSCLLFIGFIIRRVEIPLVAFGTFYLFLQLFFLFLQGFGMSSELLHLTGLLIGVPVGLAALKYEWVDCEGWDIISLHVLSADDLHKRRNRRHDERQRAEGEEMKAERRERIERLNRSIGYALQQEKYEAAMSIYEKYRSDFQNGRLLSDTALQQLAKFLQSQQQWKEVIPFYVEMLRRYPPEKTIDIRLRLAQILLQVTEQPKQAIAVLRKLPQQIGLAQAKRRDQLAQLASASLAEGSLEAHVQDW